jgi:hypothetical protein
VARDFAGSASLKTVGPFLTLPVNSGFKHSTNSHERSTKWDSKSKGKIVSAVVCVVVLVVQEVQPCNQ